MKNVIFLDIDGPMIPYGKKARDFPHNDWFLISRSKFPFESKFHPDAIKTLKEMCETHDATIVTNSMHNAGFREWDGETHIKTMFELNDKDLFDRLKPGDPRTGFATRYMSRALAVDNYLLDHPEIETYIIFDDDPTHFEAHQRMGGMFDPLHFSLTSADCIDTINVSDANVFFNRKGWRQ